MADVIPEEGLDVWGVVYEIDERDVGRLDKSEGFVPGSPREGNAYFREMRHVYRDGNEDDPLAVSVYFANQQPDPPLPDDNYKRLIVAGARYWHLPDAYIQELDQIEVAS